LGVQTQDDEQSHTKAQMLRQVLKQTQWERLKLCKPTKFCQFF
jgi:hypothetical protein